MAENCPATAPPTLAALHQWIELTQGMVAAAQAGNWDAVERLQLERDATPLPKLDPRLAEGVRLSDELRALDADLMRQAEAAREQLIDRLQQRTGAKRVGGAYRSTATLADPIASRR